MGRAILFEFIYTGTVERFGEYILEQSALVMTVPELFVGDVGHCGESGGGFRIFRQSCVPILHTSD